MARIALISDIHGNLEALEAVLEDADRAQCDRIVCLGDIVGYGPEPHHCVELVFNRCDVIVLGNHDEAAVTGRLVGVFNPEARTSISTTRSLLTDRHVALLGSVPDRARVDGIVSVAHASFGPRRFEYLYDASSAVASFTGMRTPVGAVGHTHIPSAFVCTPGLNRTAADVGGFAVPANAAVQLPQEQAVILNPGSVGQPRDRNPDASWGLLDTGRMTFQVRRIAYDVESVNMKIRALGLPEFHGERLRIGA